ncbi:MAG TPA: ABC transporter substrate-binding protein [Burkholderiaceae bacterium]|nr:ABC transporter substrate-binding protein [Burkholderiaceae bacterium]
MKTTIKLASVALALSLAGFGATPAAADVNVGISLASTGPAAALGVPQRNSVFLLPETIGGEKVNYVVLDDATDATQAGRNARKMVSEDNVDVLIGSSATPTSAAIAEVAIETETPQITMAPMDLPDEKNFWVFRTAQNFRIMADALAKHMKDSGVKTLGFIGYADAYGESWIKDITDAAKEVGIEVTNVERFNRNDTSVTGQAVKLVAANPDAILVGASGTPAVLPQVTLQERGYQGKIYQTHGAATKEFVRVGGKAVEGTIMPVGPVVVAEQLPESHPSKAVGLEYKQKYEEKHGEGSLSSFGAHLYDAALILQAAVPEALKKAKPGTKEFRAALRDAIENIEEVNALHGVFNMTPDDHFGHDERAVTMIVIEDGDWKVLD